MQAIQKVETVHGQVGQAHVSKLVGLRSVPGRVKPTFLFHSFFAFSQAVELQGA